MLVGVRVHDSPVGEAVLVSVTVPVAPLIEATVIVDVPVALANKVTAVGLALMLKQSQIVLVTVAECDRMPLVPVTVTVKVPATDALQDRVEV